MQILVLRRPSLEDYGQILLDHLVDLERLALLAIIIHLTGLLQLELISLIHSINISRFMFSSLTLLKLAYSHNRHIREPLLPHHLDHMHRGPRDSSLNWAWLWLELLRSLEILVWLFSWRHTPCHILFLLIFAYMSIAYIIGFRGMILSIMQHSIMRYKIWLFRVGQLVKAKCDHQFPAYAFYTYSSSSS